MNISSLKKQAQQIRLDTIHLAFEYKDGHVASSFSYIEIMVTLYELFLKKNDQFILSKGHGVFSLYALLKKRGFNPKISGHPDIEVEESIMCTTGSLGHGIAIAVGKALAKKIMKQKGMIYVIVGDGECQEGTIWESMNIIHRHQLDNIVVIVDHNKLQAMDTVQNIMAETNLKGKFEAFGARVTEIEGHNFKDIIHAFEDIQKNKGFNLILAHTKKGYGITFMEQDPKWQSRLLRGEEMEKAIKELGDRQKVMGDREETTGVKGDRSETIGKWMQDLKI